MRNISQTLLVTALILTPFIVKKEQIHAQNSIQQKLDKADSRIRDIYQRNTFRTFGFSADWQSDSSGYLTHNSSKGRARFDIIHGKKTFLKPHEQNLEKNNKPKYKSADGKKEFYYNKRNLFLKNLENNQSISITQKYSRENINFGNANWSPNSQHIFFTQIDHSKVRLRPMFVPGDPTYPEVRHTRFARVGGEIPSRKIGVYHVEENKVAWLPLPSPKEGFYLGQMEWAGNSNEILVEYLSRFRNKREFFLINIHNLEIKTIFSESDPAWVIASVNKNTGLEWVNNGKEFIVISEKDGWRHAYLISRDGKKETLLTSGKYDIIEKAKIDETNGWYYFYASPNDATQKYLYRVPLNGNGKLKKVTPENQLGHHKYHFSPNMKWAIHPVSTFDRPPLAKLVSIPEHKVIRVLEDNHKLVEKMKIFQKHPTEFMQLDIENGVMMDAWMIKPPNFDPSKKYPVFIYVYGEPHSQTVLNSWGTAQAQYHRAIAELGYIVVSIDNRGTPAPKGAAWRRSVYKSLGPLSTEEQAAGIKELARTRPYVDLSRVGIWGWSGGGSNTLNAMFRKPDVYHVGIAVVPKPQPHLYNAWFQEIYMETRETNPDGYHEASAINYAEGLKGNLLIIHGTGETNTHLQMVEGLVDRLIELGKPFDYFPYPNRDHQVRKGKGTVVHMRMHMIRYLLNNLKPGGV